jgi:cystathionine beta-lyase
MGGAYDYSRTEDATGSHLEDYSAKTSSAQHPFAATTGMVAFDIITRLLKPGDEVIAGETYAGAQIDF